ncbi:MAG TPA: protein kinase [Rudaea sp.]
MKTQLGHYDIVAELGRGGMGVVYKGYEPSLNRYVAIKVLADSLAHDASVKERFLREARSMAALNDAHIIQIYFIGDDEGQTYFVMEFVDGESLGSVLKRQTKLSPEQAAKIVYQTSQGLATAHDKGVIHRDIKPGNLMLTSRGAIKIADFGIALSQQDFSKKLTSTGEFVGTPGYLSPEVCLGKPVDQRSDIFSLGIVLFECLAGRMPFTDESPLGLMLEVVKAEIPDVCSLNAEVDPELSRILSRMIAKDPADRYQSCHELIADLAKHPLVSKGGAIPLQTQQSAAAATVIGGKTPVSGQRPLPSTTPTPRPMPVSTSKPTTPASPQPIIAPPASAHEPVLGRQAPASKPSALPWAIAAIVLLGLGGGAWAYRDQIPFMKTLMPASSTTLAVNAPASTTPVSTAANPAATASAVSPPAAPQTAAGTPPVPAAPVPNGDGATTAQAQSGSDSASAASSTTSQSTPERQITVVTPNGVPDASTVAANANGANAAASQGAESGPAPRASQVEPLRELPAAQAAQAAPNQQVARITEPPPVVAPPRPHIPTIAVIGGGDESVAQPAERMIEESLSRRGYHMIDQDMMPRVAHMLNGARPNMPGVLELLARSGKVDAVIVVHARPVGAEQISYYGQSSQMNTAQLTITAYAVSGQRKLGSGWSEQVHYTSMSAGDQTRDTVEPMLQQIEQNLAEFRPGRQRG